MINRAISDAVPGFELNSHSILLPTSVSYQLRCEAEREHVRLATEIAERRAAKEAAKRTLEAAESDSEETEWLFPEPPSDTPHLKIFQKEQVAARTAKLESISCDREHNNQMRALLHRIAAKGAYRKLATIPLDWRDRLADLAKNYPNFTPVLQYLRGAFSVAEQTTRVPILMPIVLDGPPGCGKTHFSHQLARLLNTEFHAVHLETMQASGEILGEADFYTNSKPGRLFDILIDGEYANPVILMDELCKLNGDPRFDPRMALYRLFERQTARVFTDACAHWLTLDYSHAWFVCTSNNFESIDKPLKSRLKRFSITMPEDPTTIIRNIAKSIISDLPVTLRDMQLTQEAIDVLKKQSPRRIRQLIECSIGTALADERRKIVAADLDVEPERKAMGF